MWCKRMMRRIFLLLSFLLCVSISVSADEADIDRLIQQMTLEQKIGQLFMIGVYDITLTAGEQAYLQEFQPGSIVLFPRNTGQSPEGVAELINALQHV
jgi:beta-N-acetylhexosaminidase